MKSSFGRQWPVYLLFMLLFVCSVSLVEFLDRSQKSFLRDSMLARAKEELSIIRSEIEASIVSDIYVANGLSSLVAANPDFDFSGWDLIASSIMRRSNNVMVVALAPDDVIQYIYPLDGNEKALGLVYQSIPEQWRTVRKAQQLQEIFIAGPVDLVQGGQGLIARVPIFIDPPYNSKYWGVCSVVMSIESLYQQVGVEGFEYKYHLAMRGVDSSGEEGEIFYGSQAVFDEAFSKEIVRFPYGSWQIAASEKTDLLATIEWYRVNAVRILGYPMTMLLLFAFSTIYRLYDNAHKRSLQDELTGLPNRRYFMYSLQQQFDLVSRDEKKGGFALLNIDLDGFKFINDTYGHAAGDKVLVAVAERLVSTLRASDTIARVGGDEFLAMLPRVNREEDVDRIRTELTKAIARNPIIYEQHLITIEVSIGHAMYNANMRNINQLLKLADSSMYDIKRQHRKGFSTS